jgi:hypothetical protein
MDVTRRANHRAERFAKLYLGQFTQLNPIETTAVKRARAFAPQTAPGARRHRLNGGYHALTPALSSGAVARAPSRFII